MDLDPVATPRPSTPAVRTPPVRTPAVRRPAAAQALAGAALTGAVVGGGLLLRAGARWISRRDHRLSTLRDDALSRAASDEVVTTDHDGVITFASRPFETRWGVRVEDLVGLRALDWIHPDDEPRVRALLERVAAATPAEIAAGTDVADSEHRYVRRRTGEIRWTRARLSNAFGVPGVDGVVWNCRDVTEERETEQALRRAAYQDALTGLANRRRLVERIAEVGRPGVGLGMVLLNLDGLKAVNDTLGHSGGDQVVAAVAARLEAVVRDGDTLARLDGDEFALLRPHPGTGLADLAGRVLAAVAVPVEVDGRSVTVTASSGSTVVVVSAAGRPPRELARRLFRETDTALTEAKHRGGARNVVFEPGLRAASRQRAELAADLGAAISAGQLRVVYQPLVDLATGRTRGFEALVRWTHPRHGVVPPSLFVPIAEERGTVADIGRYVLAQALGQLRAFDEARPRQAAASDLEISVNLSGRHLVAPGLVTEVADALAHSGIDPHRLCLEVTESSVVSDLELASAVLTELRGLGVRVALDDFGTGYSSLSYLRRLPVDVLKIDKSFVDDVTDDTAAALLRGIASMSSALGLLTIAEGIETGTARDRVRAAGCTWGQGYFFDRPLDAAEALRHLRQGAGTDAPTRDDPGRREP